MRRPVPFEIYRPTSVSEACALARDLRGEVVFLAGGTDLAIAVKERNLSPEAVVDLKRVPGLRGLTWEQDGALKIGALTTLSELENSPLVQERFPFLAQAASEVGSPQIRNRATIGGNISNASPSADTLPSLLALDASVAVNDGTAQRSIALGDFLRGPGQTAMADREVLTSVAIPAHDPGLRGDYIKLSPRYAMDLAAVGVAVTVVADELGATASARIALGAVAPTPVRARLAEAHVVGRQLDATVAEEAGAIAAGECSPIDDVRSSAAYRRAMVEVLTRRALLNSVAGSSGPISWRLRGRKRH